MLDEYTVHHNDEEDFNVYVDSFLYRLKNKNFVQTRYINENHTSGFCSQTYSSEVYTEHAIGRLSDYKDIPYPENIYVANVVLEGFHDLFEMVGYFEPTENQICVNDRYEMKVWLNSDFSRDYPCVYNRKEDGTEELMVDEIMELVLENTDEESEPTQTLRSFYDRESDDRTGFAQAKQIIAEYAR